MSDPPHRPQLPGMACFFEPIGVDCFGCPGCRLAALVTVTPVSELAPAEIVDQADVA